MEEKRLIGLLVLGTLILGLSAVGLMEIYPREALDYGGDLIVTSYEVSWQEDGDLIERYIYSVRSAGEYRMLYRAWKAPLIHGDMISGEPHIRLISASAPAGSTAYLKTEDGGVHLFNGDDPRARSLVSDLAYPNEVGIINPDYFTPGLYTVEYVYQMVPPVEYDRDAVHINLMLADEHIPYESVTITLISDRITDVFTHPPSYEVETREGMVVITGRSPSNERIGVEFLMTPDALDQVAGVKRQVEGVREKTESANNRYLLGFLIADLLLIIGKILVVITPFLLLLLYYLYGREKEFTVPEYLSTVPDETMPPWQVNLVFNKDAFTADENGFYATLLDLHRKKKIEIRENPDEKGVTIRLLKVEGDDPYEQRVINFIHLNSDESGILDTGYFEEVAKRAKTSSADEQIAIALKDNLNDLMSWSDERISGRYAVSGREKPAIILAGAMSLTLVGILAFLLTIDIERTLLAAMLLFVVVAVQAGIAVALPSTVFGHWKEDYYRLKLEWSSFRRFLTDMSMIKKYSPDDMNMWGIWLIYGTALGVGENVQKAMKELKVDISQSGYYVPTYVWFAGFYSISTFSPPSQGGGGGGFGAGGGFGGGGAGGR
ncbi:putative membrane protein [Methanocalculus alkaliphilus]|uniref:DUF2207 domain-containing protein n=1 Tax=Methanocalculus alkaliphilus TaxID=768730 RepID=UPI00209EB779|nr:DUF2207 domain-containing protein [Methanocalculus alkaliphilus]MCP1714658.1 putative membrane protein [Methanocalculus alkaliphilus]